jgi:outer membrane receptor protein involved in Fe transport
VGGANNPHTPDPVTGKYNTHDTQFLNKLKTWSFFGQVRIEPIEGFELAAGGRYTDEKKDTVLRTLFVHPQAVAGFRAQGVPLNLKKKENNFSPEITASWRMTDELMVYTAYKTGYLAGGFSNPGILGPAASAATLEFDEEKARGFEAGIKFSSSDRRLNGSLVGYRYNYKGLQLTSFNAVNVTFQTQNAADTRVQGVEIEGVYRPIDALTLRASVAYNDAYFKDFPGAQCFAGQTVAQGCVTARQDLSGRPVYRAPEWVASGGARYEFNLGDFRLDLGGDFQYVSKYYATLNLNPGSLQDSYWLLNAGIGLEREGSPWRVSLIGKNLTDKIYGTLGNDAAGGAGDSVATTGEPRTVSVRLEYRFF